MVEYGIFGDSGEYEFLTEAIELSKDVPGMCVEIGLRRGLGTKTIIDAVREYCPGKTVIAVDPYGSILYQPREHVEPCRLDYTNQMKAETLAALWAYVAENPVDFHFFCMTDTEYFRRFDDCLETYPEFEGDKSRSWLYSMAHLDGPHNYEAVSREIIWFNQRMKSGAVIVIDDITPDFIKIEPINELLISLGWEILKQGFKKGLYQKN